MSYAYEVREKFEGLLSQITEIAGAVMLEHKDEIVAFLIDQHTIDFVDSFGNPLRTEIRKYVFDFSENNSPFRIQGKSGSENVDDLYMRIDGELYIIDSTAITKDGELKSKFLEIWNGAPIMDLTPENEAKIYPIIQDDFVTRLSEVVGLD